jgi:hypothetical protein
MNAISSAFPAWNANGDDEDDRPEPPADLGGVGLQLWADLTDGLTFAAHEVPTLIGICRTRNRCEAIAADLAGAPTTVRNAKGELIQHPLLVEERMQWAHLNRALAQLRIPDEDGSRGQRRGGYRQPYGGRKYGNANPGA